MTMKQHMIEAALDLVENLAANGVRLSRCDETTLEASITPTPALHSAIQRNFDGVMAVIDAREAADRLIQRARRKSDRPPGGQHRRPARSRRSTVGERAI